jgi:alpha-2-macroglobulin
MIARLSLFFLSISITFCANAQSDSTWSRIERSIGEKRNLIDLRRELYQWRQAAVQQQDYGTAARCFNYLMVIADKTTEDTLFFKNALFVDSILNTRQSPQQLKAIMHVLKAKRIVGFKKRFYTRQNKIFVSSYEPLRNYSIMSAEALDSVANLHFENALQTGRSLAGYPVKSLTWLAFDPNTFLFEPGFEDIVHAERINALFNNPAKEDGQSASSWLQLSQDAFIQLESLQLSRRPNQVFRYYKQWIQHQAGNPQAYYFIETLARKYLFNLLREDSVNSKLYEQYLQSLLASPHNTVKAHAVYQLCLLWNEEALKYNPTAYSTDLRYLYNYPFNDRYRKHYVKALELFRQHEQILELYPAFNKLLRAMAVRMQEIELGFSMEDEQLPGKPMPALLRFRNAQKLYMRTIRWNFNDRVPDAKKRTELETLFRRAYIHDTVISLPVTGDYQLHNTFIKLNPLPAGRYLILYSDSAITPENEHLDFLRLDITRIAAINNDDRLFVLDRETGFPLTGAQVSTAPGSNMRTVNKEGFATIHVEKNKRLTIWYKGDTVNYSANKPEEYEPDDLYDKEEYEDLLEYYEDNTMLQIFTDRAIYRPGQTVHYKGIYMVRHPRTGEQLILNWKNLKFPFFSKLYYKLARTFSRRKMEIYIEDPFDNERDTILILPDKFGSFSGSYKIPADAATGEWGFETYDVDIDGSNFGEFRVEEYKRPTFEIKLEKPVGHLQLKDSFTVKTIAKSFAGAQLNNVLVNYTVTASGYLPDTDGRYHHVRDTITAGEAYTDESGELLIHIIDRKISDINFSDDREWTRDYHVSVEAVDATGESHDEQEYYQMSSRPVNFELSVPSMMERNELPSLYIAARSDYGGYVKKTVKVQIFSTPPRRTGNRGEDWPQTDTWVYDSLQFRKWFPEFLLKDAQKTEDVLVHEITLLSGDTGRLILPFALLPAGEYRIGMTAYENDKNIGEISRSFAVFDKAHGIFPDFPSGFEYLPYNQVQNGENFTWYTGTNESTIYSIYHASWYEKDNRGHKIKFHYTTRPEKKGLNQWDFRIPKNAVERVTITHLYIVNNRLFKKQRDVYISGPAETNPEIIVEKYRTKLAPGTQETFTVSIKTKNENVVAQLMTTMYDATLDKLAEHRWRIPDERNYYGIGSAWNYGIDSRVSSRLESIWRNADQYGYREPLWWLNPLDYGYGARWADTDYGDTQISFNRMLSGRVAGVDITNTRGLDEVVVVGYSVAKKASFTGAVASVRGLTSLTSFGKIMYVLDGKIFEGDPGTINLNTITQGVILKGAEATALFGSKAANGVLLLSTKGPVQLPGPPPPPAPVIRKNFSETAFFYPRIYAGRNGIYTIKFTLSESVTTWKWKMLAHTKKAAFAYAEKTVISQLPLMVQPDMPRFLYQGDKIVLKTRISNLDTAACIGQLQCTLEDMITGEDITTQLIKTSRKEFSVASASTGAGSFEIQIPENLLHPLRIRITAQSKSYSDGEEHVIPILSRKILVAQSVPVVLNDQKQNNLSKPTFPADAQPYGMALFITPQPQAALINALPWLANYQYGCAEQTFNKMLAHAIAVKMVRTDTTLQRLLARKNFAGSSTPAPGELPEESMPWLQLNHRHAVQQQQLAKLFDTISAHAAMRKFFDELKKMQNSDGGISWFPGGKSDHYISTYILAGFGKLTRDGLPLPEERLSDYFQFMFKLMNYCDTSFLDTNKVPFKYMNLFYLYARSFWAKRYAITSPQLSKIDSLITDYWHTQNFSAVGNAAMLAIATMRMLPKENSNYAKALELLESLRQSAIRDEQNGIRWKTYADSDNLNMLTEEWLVKTAEAFEEDANDKETIPGMITWLLKTRNEYNWSTTKSTADAVSLLHRKQAEFIAKPLQMEATVNDTSLRVTNDLFTGNLFVFKEMTGKTFPQQTAVATQAAQGQSGGINYYYFTADPPAEETATGVKIVKTIKKFNSSTSSWESLSAATILKPGDKLRTTLTITTTKQLQYVFIDEKRAAACEPTEALSGYESGKGISYYKSVRDIGFQFFADQVASGISEISYETVIAKTGRFTYGPAALQCMYRPDIKAYSNSLHIEVKE